MPRSGWDECAARPVARSLTRKAPRVASPSLLSVGSPFTRKAGPGEIVGGRGPVAAALLADDEQEPHALLARLAQALRRRHLRGQDALRVAGAAAVQAAVSTRLGKNGGTQSTWVEKTTVGSGRGARGR